MPGLAGKRGRDGNPINSRAVPDPLQVLLGRIADGDEEAYRVFYSCTVRRVFGLALKIVRRPELAEEIVQEVFVQVWFSVGGCDSSRGSPLAWLLMLTHRRAVDVVRREQRCRERDSRHHREISALVTDSTEEVVLRSLKNEEILRSLSTTRAPQAEAIVPGVLGRADLLGSAGTLNLSVPAVKSRIREGFSAMRQPLGPPGQD